jgi:hypothetical protein
MNWSILIPVGIGALALVIFLAWRNWKDEKKVVNDMKSNYPRSKDEEGDTEIEEVMK